LLVELAFGCRFRFADVASEGIRRVTQDDIAFARGFGLALKHLAVAVRHKEGIEARVHPAMVPQQHPLARVDGALNAIVVDSEALESSMYVGLGAGMMPTATAVVGDLMEIARNRLHGCRGRVAPLGLPAAQLRKVATLPAALATGTYYLRLLVLDRPGELAKISGILGRAGISIASMLQQPAKRRGSVTLVMRTHETRRRSLDRAVRSIEKLQAVRGDVVAIRIEESL
jgi:homoserine dehydrogenase